MEKSKRPPISEQSVMNYNRIHDELIRFIQQPGATPIKAKDSAATWALVSEGLLDPNVVVGRQISFEIEEEGILKKARVVVYDEGGNILQIKYGGDTIPVEVSINFESKRHQYQASPGKFKQQELVINYLLADEDKSLQAFFDADSAYDPEGERKLFLAIENDLGLRSENNGKMIENDQQKVDKFLDFLHKLAG